MKSVGKRMEHKKRAAMLRFSVLEMARRSIADFIEKVTEQGGEHGFGIAFADDSDIHRTVDVYWMGGSDKPPSSDEMVDLIRNHPDAVDYADSVLVAVITATNILSRKTGLIPGSADAEAMKEIENDFMVSVLFGDMTQAVFSGHLSEEDPDNMVVTMLGATDRVGELDHYKIGRNLIDLSDDDPINTMSEVFIELTNSLSDL